MVIEKRAPPPKELTKTQTSAAQPQPTNQQPALNSSDEERRQKHINQIEAVRQRQEEAIQRAKDEAVRLQQEARARADASRQQQPTSQSQSSQQIQQQTLKPKQIQEGSSQVVVSSQDAAKTKQQPRELGGKPKIQQKVRNLRPSYN